MINRLVLCLLCCVSIHAISQVGINTLSPADESMLDIESTDKGILIPRVNIENLQAVAPITGGVTESLLVYNINATTGEGFYFWKDNRWNLISSYDSDVRGLQFYAYQSSFSPPDINISTIRNILPQGTGVIATSGHYTGPLNITHPSSGYNSVIIKYIGTYTVQNSGIFDFASQTDDGARIYVDGVLILNSWVDGSTNIGSGSVYLAKGKHKFEFWVYNNTGGFNYNFSWGAGINPDGNTGIINATQFTIEY